MIVRAIGPVLGRISLTITPAPTRSASPCAAAFPGGVGKTSGPADFTSLLDDVEKQLFGQLPDDTWFYPGHGKDSTLGAERPAFGEWRARGW
jgi:hypothetical protein